MNPDILSYHAELQDEEQRVCDALSIEVNPAIVVNFQALGLVYPSS